VEQQGGLTGQTDRDRVLDDLARLHAKLAQAQAENDQGTIMLARHDIDEALEQLHQCPDPASTASEAEWGKAG
jgi:hypothetical protein